MSEKKLQELLDKSFLTQEEFQKLQPVVSKKIFSVFYELQTLLYLGVMLFTTGAGILIYKNIGDLGHLIAIAVLGVLCTLSFWYVTKKGLPYQHDEVTSPTPYFDYVLLLGSLLFVSIQGYLQFQYRIFDENLSTGTLVTALVFFFLAYRYDHTGVLSLAITSFASFWGLAVSPVKWYQSDFLLEADLHRIGIIFSIAVIAIAWVLHRQQIKQHFTFTIFHFGLLIFFCAAVVGLFVDDHIYGAYVLLIYLGCAFAYYGGKLTKSFLFLIYAFLAGYIATTYLLAVTIFQNADFAWFYYFLLSCGGFVYFIIRFKNHFRQS